MVVGIWHLASGRSEEVAWQICRVADADAGLLNTPTF